MQFRSWVMSSILLLIMPELLRAEPEYDVVVYGGTSGGVTAAIQATRMGKSVVLVEPTLHIGGLTSGGLGATDIGNKGAIGGLSREFYRRIRNHYRDPSAWKLETFENYAQSRQSAIEEELWTFEPHVAEQIFRQWLDEFHVPMVRGRLNLSNGVNLDGPQQVTRRGGKGPRIVSIQLDNGPLITGRMFIDASYEGDLMAKGGCQYHVGREAISTYGESLNGFQVAHAKSHQFIKDIDPYIIPGDPSSGLLPLVQAEAPGNDGDGDRGVQAYCFRLCTTDVPENRLPWPKPDGYDPKHYELLLRNFDAGDHRIPWHPLLMPNRKTDTNNNFAISTDFIGANYDYPDGDYSTRERIIREHRDYQLGLIYTLANHPRVPAVVREHFQNWGLAKDEFQDSNHWPHQLYVREARRLVSEYVMTQNHCHGNAVCEDPVGLGAYNMDSHNVRRYVNRQGKVRNEGDIQVAVSPYPIAYRSIRPRQVECENLLVPVCLAASHIAYGSIRMEPVFMVLGQSAATAACLALDANVAVQEIDYTQLQHRLLKDQQVLIWAGPKESTSRRLK